MSVLFGFEILKPGPSKQFLELKQEFKEFKAKEEREDPIQEQKIRDIEVSIADVESMRMKNVQDLKERINTVASSLARTDNNLDTVVVATKGHTQKLEEIEKKMNNNKIMQRGKNEALKSLITKKQLEEAMNAAATKQQQEIQAFKEEMKKQYQMISYQLQYKNAKINEKGNQLLDARRKVLNPSGGKKKKKNNNRTI